MRQQTENESRQRRLFALIKKESYQIIRDPSTTLISVVLPLFLLFIYGFGVSLDLNHLRLGLVLEETSQDAMNFADSLRGSRYFDLTIGRDRREMYEPLTSGAIRGFIVVPQYFSEFRRLNDHVAPIQVIADGSEPNTANFVQYYAQGAFQNWQRQEAESQRQKALPLVQARQRVWYNEELESRYFLFSGSIAIIMTLIGTLLTALVVAREWERGTMEAMMSTPVGIIELVMGKLIPYFVLGMISMLLCIIVTVLGFGLPLRGSFWLLIIDSAIFLVGALGLGLMISTLVKNQIVAYQISIVAGFLPAFILSGFLFEIASMPLPIRILTYFLPARYFVQSLQTIFLVGNVWHLILLNMIPMILIGVILFIITAVNTVKRLD